MVTRAALDTLRRMEQQGLLSASVYEEPSRKYDSESEIVTYLGIWYRYLGAAVRALPLEEGSWD